MDIFGLRTLNIFQWLEDRNSNYIKYISKIVVYHFIIGIETNDEDGFFNYHSYLYNSPIFELLYLI